MRNLPPLSHSKTLHLDTPSQTMAMINTPFPGSVPGYTWAPGTCGVLVPGTQARIVRDDGSDAPLGEAGHLLYKGPNVGLGYLGNEMATRETFDVGGPGEGWLNTGDRFRTPDGINFLCVPPSLSPSLNIMT
jgi:acyl-CoA synthetase (AMP-forming)/AMP-acid ligase II